MITSCYFTLHICYADKFGFLFYRSLNWWLKVMWKGLQDPVLMPLPNCSCNCFICYLIIPLWYPLLYIIVLWKGSQLQWWATLSNNTFVVFPIFALQFTKLYVILRQFVSWIWSKQHIAYVVARWAQNILLDNRQ